MAEVEADVVALRRGLILAELHLQYPGWLLRRALEGRVLSLYTDARGLTQDLAYLEERGLVARERQGIGGVTLESWRLTADGVDVAQGHRVLPGITLKAGA